MEKMCILLASDKMNLPLVLKKEVALVVGIAAIQLQTALETQHSVLPVVLDHNTRNNHTLVLCVEDEVLASTVAHDNDFDVLLVRQAVDNFTLGAHNGRAALPRNPQPLYSSHDGPARTAFRTRIDIVVDVTGLAVEPQHSVREETTVAAHHVASGQCKALLLANHRQEDIHVALAVVLLDRQRLESGRMRYESIHCPHTTECMNMVFVALRLDSRFVKRSALRVFLEPRVVQCLGISQGGSRYILQTDAVLWVALEESVNEVLRLVAQSRVARMLLVVHTTKHGGLQLPTLVREREARGQIAPHSTHHIITSHRWSRRATRCPPSCHTLGPKPPRDSYSVWCQR